MIFMQRSEVNNVGEIITGFTFLYMSICKRIIRAVSAVTIWMKIKRHQTA